MARRAASRGGDAVVRNRLAYLLALVAGSPGCGRAEMWNTVVARADSPGGRLTALLVDRTIRVALSNNEVFLVVIPASQNPDTAIAARKLGRSAVLVATNATKLQLAWQGNDTLRVICDSCGLEPIDIEKRLDHFGAITIRYEGVPAQPPAGSWLE